MFKFLVLVSLIFAVHARSIQSFSSFEEALQEEINKYDFEATHEHDLSQFESFKSDHKKQYETKEEEQKRFGIFRINLIKIKLLNLLDTAEYGVTRFSDLEESEFEERYTGVVVDQTSERRVNSSIDMTKDLPAAVDWRQQGAVTPVKDQARCGSCWSFAATGSIEAQNKIVNGELLSFSEQELVDCDEQSHGCNGGLMTFAYEAIEKLGGLELENDYPYTAQNGECGFKKNLAKVQVASYENLNKDENEIAQYVAQRGPVAIGINAGLMQNYKSGIARPNFITKWMCSPKRLNHGVLIVGFGSDPQPHWIIKNSWTESWGREGYYYLYRGENACGVREMASIPTVTKH